jgi:hypothetical protein
MMKIIISFPGVQKKSIFDGFVIPYSFRLHFAKQSAF